MGPRLDSQIGSGAKQSIFALATSNGLNEASFNAGMSVQKRARELHIAILP